MLGILFAYPIKKTAITFSSLKKKYKFLNNCSMYIFLIIDKTRVAWYLAVFVADFTIQFHKQYFLKTFMKKKIIH